MRKPLLVHILVAMVLQSGLALITWTVLRNGAMFPETIPWVIAIDIIFITISLSLLYMQNPSLNIGSLLKMIGLILVIWWSMTVVIFLVSSFFLLVANS